MVTQEKQQNMTMTSWRKSPLLHCVTPPLFDLCVLGDTSGGLQYISNCHTTAPVNTMGLMVHRQPVSSHPTLFIYLIVA